MARTHFATEGHFDFGFRHPDTHEICPPNQKQRIALGSLADWLFYGGAVGGGKTAWLAVEAVKHCLRYPGARAVLFRRTSVELEASIVLELLAIIPLGLAHYNGKQNRYEFANGSILWLRHCQHEKDVFKYQGYQFSFLGIDEASHFTEFMFLYLVTRVRSPRKGIPKVVRLASNPGGPGHGWLKRKFVRPRAEEVGDNPLPLPFDIWRPLPPPGGKVKPEEVPTRQFIPAFFQDNEILQQVNPQYLASIYQIGGDYARQLAEGDWDANESMVVGGEWREHHLVIEGDALHGEYGLAPGTVVPWHVYPDRTWLPPAGALIFGSVDYGYGAPWSFHLHAALPGGHVRTFFELYQARVRDAVQAQRIRKVLELFKYKPEWIVMDPSMWNARAEVGMKSIAEVYDDELFIPLNLVALKGAGGRPARMSRPNRWKAALSTSIDGLPNWTITTACPEAIRTIPEVPWDPDDVEVEDDASENHAYEDIGRFFEARPFAPVIAPTDVFKGLDPISKAHQEAMARKHGEIPKKGSSKTAKGWGGIGR